ncbi:MAG: RNA polymerase sigma factor [Thermoleophilia bacterium]|nr:RNA polymerase sigma factor [Thermoleophilia bacterium]
MVRRSRDGDHGAFGTLVARHQAVALRVAALMGPPADAEDACQEAFVKAHRALGRFDPNRPFRPWLLAIVANEARDRRRREGRATRLLEHAAALLPPDGAADDERERALARVGVHELRHAFARLREDDRRILALRFLLDLPEREAAAVLGCATGTVKSRTARALGRLRAAIGEAP